MSRASRLRISFKVKRSSRSRKFSPQRAIPVWQKLETEEAGLAAWSARDAAGGQRPAADFLRSATQISVHGLCGSTPSAQEGPGRTSRLRNSQVSHFGSAISGD